MRAREGRRAGAREGARGKLPWGRVTAMPSRGPTRPGTARRTSDIIGKLRSAQTLCKRQEHKADTDLATSKPGDSGPSQTEEDKACGSQGPGWHRGPQIPKAARRAKPPEPPGC